MTDPIQVPDIEHDTLCFKQAPNMVRCDRPKGHAGRHTWEYEQALEAAQQQASGFYVALQKIASIVTGI